MTNSAFLYKAFISYAHADRTWWGESWGNYVHRSIERFSLPGPRSKKNGTSLKPVFIDRAELSAHGDLEEAIQQSLRESEFLIVICSPAAARSRHVNQEVAYFKSLGRERQMLCLIIAGTPNSGGIGANRSHQECFPDAVRRRVTTQGVITDVVAEPIAADARRMGDGYRNALLKTIAALSGYRFDDLRQREQQRVLRRRTVAVSLMTFVAVGFAGLYWYAMIQRNEALRREEVALARMYAARAPVEQLRLRQDMHAAQMALEAYVHDDRSGGDAAREVSQALRQVLSQPYFSSEIATTGTLPVGSASVSPNAGWLLKFDSGQATMLTIEAKGLSKRASWRISNQIKAAVIDDAGPTALYTTEAGAELVALGPKDIIRRQSLAKWPQDFIPVQLDAGRQRALVRNAQGCHAVLKLGELPAQMQCLFRLAGESFAVTRSADSMLSVIGAVGSQDLWLVDWRTGQPVTRSVRLPLAEGLQALAVDPDGKKLAIGSHTGRLWLLDLSTRASGKLLGETPYGSMNSVAFLSDGLSIASGSQEGIVSVWSPGANGWRRTDLRGHDAPIDVIVAALDVWQMLSIDTGGLMRRWHLDPELAEPAVLHVDAYQPLLFTPKIHALAVRPASSQFVVSGDHGLFQLWDARSLKVGPRIFSLGGPTLHVMSAAFSADGTLLVGGRVDGQVTGWDLAKPDQPVGAFRLPSGVIPWTIGPDGAAGVVVGDSKGGLTLWPEVKRPAHLTRSVHPDLIRSLAYSSESGKLFTGSDQGDVKSFRIQPQADDFLKNSRIVRPKQVHHAIVGGLASSPDGSRLAVADAQGVSLLQFESSETKQIRPAGGEFDAWAIALSGDGALLAAGGADGIIRLWNTRRLDQQPELLTGHASFVRSLAFLPAENILISTSFDGSVRLWSTDTKQLVHKACKLLDYGNMTARQGNAPEPLWQSACTRG
jgi:WD40 repeat protein